MPAKQEFREEVDATHLVSEIAYNHLILFDPTVEQINAAHKALPDTFIFSFLTVHKNVSDKCWADLECSDFVIYPIYLGNVPPSYSYTTAHNIVKQSLRIKVDRIEKINEFLL